MRFEFKTSGIIGTIIHRTWTKLDTHMLQIPVPMEPHSSKNTAKHENGLSVTVFNNRPHEGLNPVRRRAMTIIVPCTFQL